MDHAHPDYRNQLEAPHPIAGENTLNVVLKSAPGSFLTIRITRRDIEPPTVQLPEAPKKTVDITWIMEYQPLPRDYAQGYAQTPQSRC